MNGRTGGLASLREFVFSYGFYILLLFFIVLFSLISNSFLTVSNWTQISIVACFLLTASAGLTLVVITGNIDLSVGSVAYLAAAVVYLTADFPPAVTDRSGAAYGGRSSASSTAFSSPFSA